MSQSTSNKLPHPQRASLSYTHRVARWVPKSKEPKKANSGALNGVLQFKPSDYAPVYSPGKSGEFSAVSNN